MFLMIDNYDSFVYNLVRYIKELGEEVLIVRNDKITFQEIQKIKLDGIIISPGPKKPVEAGITLEIINRLQGKVPILGICLGHQAIGYAFGANIVQGKEPAHGIISEVMHDEMGLFNGIKNPLLVTRYHSLIVERNSMPTCLEITSKTHDGVIMGIRHKDYLIEGLQFHPEAELTESGHEILKNFIDMCKGV